MIPKHVTGIRDHRPTWVLTALGLREADSRGVSWLVNHADVHFVFIGVKGSKETQHSDSLQGR